MANLVLLPMLSNSIEHLNANSRTEKNTLDIVISFVLRLKLVTK